ncbi:MAG: hypothetical protein FWG89_03270 [Treponema sp.]|nr:hypothetical protein [Treponema sp.]
MKNRFLIGVILTTMLIFVVTGCPSPTGPIANIQSSITRQELQDKVAEANILLAITRGSNDGNDVATTQKWVPHEVYDELVRARDEARRVSLLPNPTIAEIENSYDDIVAAIENAEDDNVWNWGLSWSAADKTDLNLKIIDAETVMTGIIISVDGTDLPPSIQWVTQFVWDNLNSALEAAYIVQDDDDATQAEINNAATVLEIAINNFIPENGTSQTLYGFLLDNNEIELFTLTGAQFIRPADPVVTITNTGVEALTILTEITGPGGNIFSISPATAIIPSGDSAVFTIQLLINDPGNNTFDAFVFFTTDDSQGGLLSRVDISYIGCQFINVDIDISGGMLYVGKTGVFATTNEPDKGSNPWYSSNSSVAAIDPDTGELTINGSGDVIIGYILNANPLTLKGRVVRVPVSLIPRYPLEAGVLSRPAGSTAGLLNLNEIDAAASGNEIRFTRTGGESVISAINGTTGALTFRNDAAPGTNSAITVTLIIVSYTPEGEIITHAGDAAFSVRVGDAPPPLFVSAGTINSVSAIQTVTVEAIFNGDISATSQTHHAGFTISRNTTNLTIQSSAIANNRIIFTLAGADPILYGHVITISYNDTAGTINNNGVSLASFTGRPVTNNLREVEPGPAMQTVEIDGLEHSISDRLVITYDKPPVLTSLAGFSIENTTAGAFVYMSHSVSANRLTIILNRSPVWSEITATGGNALRVVYNGETGNVVDAEGWRKLGGSETINFTNFSEEEYNGPEVEEITLNASASTSLVIQYTKHLSGESGRGGFMLNGAPGVSFTNHLVSGDTLTLTLSRAPAVAEVAAGLTLSYNSVTGSISDGRNRAESFTNIPVITSGQFQTPPVPENAAISSDSPTSLVLGFDRAVNIANTQGFSVSGSATATNIMAVSGSGSTTLTFTLNLKPAFGETVTLSYNGALGNVVDNTASDVAVATFDRQVSLTGFTENDHGRPVAVSAAIDAGSPFSQTNARNLVVTFNKAVTANTTGFSLTGSETARTFTGVTGSGTTTLTFAMNDWPSWNETDFTLHYNRNLGTASDANNNLLVDFSRTIELVNFGTQMNIDEEPPRIVRGLIENHAPLVLRLAFDKPVAITPSLFQVKVHGTPWVNYASVTVPVGGTQMDVGIVTRNITAASPVSGTNNAVWNLTMSESARYGEIIRVATTAAGAARSVAADVQLPVIPQFIVRSEIRRVKDTWEDEAGFYRNGVRDTSITDGTGGQMYNNILNANKLGTQSARHADHPREGEVITIVLDSDQNVTVNGPWNSFSQADLLRDRQFGGATIIFTTTTANVNSANPRTIYINVGNVTPRWAQNNITMIIDEYIVLRRDPAVASRSAALIMLGDGGKLILDGGEIRDNSASGDGNTGGALTVGGGSYGGMVLINRGRITGNTLTATGTGVAQTHSTIAVDQNVIIVMHDGEISGNTVNQTANPNSPRAAVISHFNNSAQNHGKSSFYMTGGVIAGNRLTGAATYTRPAAGAVIVNGTFMKVGGTIYGANPDPALANTTSNFNHAIRADAVVVLTTFNGTIQNMTAAQSYRRNATSGPDDVLVADCSKTANGNAGNFTIPTWIRSYWD